MTNFVVTGVLWSAASVGLRRALRGPGSVWAPRLVLVFGAALAAGGAFRMDAAFGFPPGTPQGTPPEVTWHGAIHGIVFPVGFAALVAACFVFARRFATLGRPGWRWASVIAGPAALLLAAWPSAGDPDGRFLPLWIGVVVAMGWLSAVIGDARRHQQQPHKR